MLAAAKAEILPAEVRKWAKEMSVSDHFTQPDIMARAKAMGITLPKD